jgi:rhamnulose-1-phosphate aldolase
MDPPDCPIYQSNSYVTAFINIKTSIHYEDIIMINEPYPSLEDLLTMIGETGKRLYEIGASEGTAGNISVCVRWPVEPHKMLPSVRCIELPQHVLELEGSAFVVTGSGQRLREIIENPPASLGVLVVNKGGKTADLYTSRDCKFKNVTSEFNSHLGVHYDQMLASNTNFHAVIHTHPPYLTYLSHIPRYQDTIYLSQHVMRWQPEIIVNLPDGIGFAPFEVPASSGLVAANVGMFRNHHVVVWSKHGVMTRSDSSLEHAADRMEYAETGARYEYHNLTTGEIGEGLSVGEIHAICKAFKVQQHIF